MATECNLSPFINQEFYITGTWGEERSGHLHAGLDLSTGGINEVYNMKEGLVIYQDPNGTSGSGYGPYLIVQSLDGTTWLYGDLSPFAPLPTNRLIPEGEFLALEGNPSGTASTGYHVHIELERLTYGESFKYGFNNSSDPATPLGLPNLVGGPYIYYGEPTPPEPSILKRKFNWKVFTKKIKERRNLWT